MSVINKIPKILPKIPAGLALGAVVFEAGKIAKGDAIEQAKIAESKAGIRTIIGNSKMDNDSYIYNSMKNDGYDRYPYGLTKAWHGTKGFIHGFFRSLKNNFLIGTCAVLALLTKADHKKAQIASLAALGVSVLYGIIKNGTSLFERRDYLE